MTVKQTDCASAVAGVVAMFTAAKYASVNSEVGTIVTALGSDTTTHPPHREATPAALTNGNDKTPFTNAILLEIAIAKSGNLNQEQIIAALNGAIGTANKPANIDPPFISSSATPPITGSVLTAQNGNWTNAPSSFTYQWQRDGSNIGAATSSTYTLIGADTGGHRLTCNVVATNATGSATFVPSNVIFVP